MASEVSIIIPVFNEQDSISKVVTDIRKNLSKKSKFVKFEIIVVDDGSTDDTSKIIKKLKAKRIIQKVLTHIRNKGYGAALKTGISASKYEWILIVDGDSTYPASVLYDLIRAKEDCHMVIGARTKKDVSVPLSRRFPKLVMLWTAKVLSQNNIQDLNSGLRIFDKRLAEEFWHLFPQGFSFTSTITLGSHLNGFEVKYLPISYYKRVGKSSISFMHFFYFMLLVIKMVVYYKPLQFFFIPGISFLAFGFLWTVYTLLTNGNVTDSGVLIFMIGLQISLFGLIADLVVKTREHLHNNKVL